MKSLTIIGRRWFDRTNGNTYHSVTCIVDDENVGGVSFAYGFSDHYLQTAREYLEEKDLLPRDPAPLWQYCLENGITLNRHVTDVARKKDL